MRIDKNPAELLLNNPTENIAFYYRCKRVKIFGRMAEIFWQS
jgi:hypothetical protein